MEGITTTDNDGNDARLHTSDRARTDRLITELGSRHGVVRLRARRALVEVGPGAVGPLLETLAGSGGQLRWEAAKALSEIGHPSAAAALVQALEDERPGVRWLAGDGLIAMGHAALEPVLRSLTLHCDSPWLRQGAHHVLRVLARHGFEQQLAPVLGALEDMEPSLVVPQAALEALDGLDRAA